MNLKRSPEMEKQLGSYKIHFAGHMCANAMGGQRYISDVFFHTQTPYYLTQELSLNLEPADSTSLCVASKCQDSPVSLSPWQFHVHVDMPSSVYGF